MALHRWQKTTRREYKRSLRTRRGNLRAAPGGPLVPVEPEKADILLDAPQLKVQNLALEIENLELAHLIRIGKVQLEVESLDAELFLQTQLGDLLDTLNRLTSTLNFGLSLFFAPVYNFNLAMAAWYNYLELTRRWLELPVKFSDDWKQSERLPVTRLPRVPSASGNWIVEQKPARKS